MVVMAFMVLVMATVACSVEWNGLPTPTLTMTVPVMSMTVSAPTQTPTEEVKSCPGLVRAAPGGDGTLNLRAGAGTSYRVLLVLLDGEEVEISGPTGGWYAARVIRDGDVYNGFVRSDYVECK